MPLAVGGVPNSPPLADTLISPANASFEDLSGAPEFEWEYNPGTLGNAQTAWAMRRKVAGASSYLYWNVSTTSWQSGLVWNSGTAVSYTFSSGEWTDGNVYNWSVASQDANGTGPFAADFTVSAQVGPTLTITAPAGTVGTADPVIQWLPALAGSPAGIAQASFQIIIVTSAVYAGGAIDWDTVDPSNTLYESGIVGAAINFVDPELELDPGSYVVGIQITETGGQASPWTISAFTVSYLAPADPTFTVVPGTDPDTGAPMTTLTCVGNDGGSTSGYVGITVASFIYSDDAGVSWWPVRGGTNVPLPADTQTAVVVDYEAPPGFSRSYQVIVSAEI